LFKRFGFGVKKVQDVCDINATILIADDSALYAGAHAKMLLGPNCTIIYAANGYETLVSAESHQPDVILLDIVMPVMDGFSALRRLKANPKTKNIPVIMTSAKSEMVDVSYSKSRGAFAYLIKPIDREEMVKTIKRALFPA